MSGIYEQLNRRNIPVYTGYMDALDLVQAQKRTQPMEGVTIINNGLWHAYPDEEFKFEKGNGILDVLEEWGTRQLSNIELPNPLEQPIGDYIVGFDPATELPDQLSREAINRSVNVIYSPTRRTESRYRGELLWSQLRREPEELLDSITVTREFETEQEAIAYLDSLSQEITEDEENTDIV